MRKPRSTNREMIQHVRKDGEFSGSPELLVIRLLHTGAAKSGYISCAGSRKTFSAISIRKLSLSSKVRENQFSAGMGGKNWNFRPEFTPVRRHGVVKLGEREYWV